MKFLVFLLPLTVILGVSAVEPNLCDNLPPPGTGFVNDPRSCAAYVSCQNYLGFKKECPSPYYFNSLISSCDLPENVHCNNCPPTGISSIANPSSCSLWTLCVNGHALPQKCAPGTSFDERVGTCNLAEKVVCGVDTCSQLPLPGIGTAPSPESCDTFYYCYRGSKVMSSSCPPQLLFDTVTSRCVRSDATCFPGSRRPQ